MPIDDVAAVDIDLSDPPLGTLDFATPLIAVELTTDQDSAFGSDVTRVVTPTSWQADMAELEVVSGEQLYEALLRLFQQENRPTRAMIGRRDVPVAQVATITIPASPSAVTYVVTINGVVAASIAGSGLTQTQLRDAIDTAIDASAVAPVVGATVSSNDVLVTADEEGVPFTIAVSGTGLAVSITTPNVGLPEDLAAWQAEDPSWYMLLEDSRTDGNILAAANTIEAFGSPKVFLAQSADAAANTSATDDLGSQLRDLGYFRTALCSYSDDAAWMDAALAGATLSQPPGSITFSNRRLVGVTGTEYLTTTQAMAKRWTVLERFRAAGISATRGGRVAQGTAMDLIIARDAIKATMQTRGLELVTSLPKLPYTNSGAEQLANYAVRSVLNEFAARPYNVVVGSSIEVRVRPYSQQTTTDRGNRHWAGIDWSCTLQGAIDSFDIHGTMTA